MKKKKLIISLISLERNMGLYDRYHVLCERVNVLDISESTVSLKQLAGEVYEGMRKG
jgi:hypothetical protein